ncbi:LuxR C-terminal-related transcriptional regulator [Pseudonocardia sp. TRM90224]|uniref:LuxR C-terminal-related transcriptional regulator n=1 Tax=Pseudonocardia sp. TRM90224 TaxID=2812678 RepID=UPI001E52A221|nr:response regulator transcription factor [Pseudonocardia sp. TRM90224]
MRIVIVAAPGSRVGVALSIGGVDVVGRAIGAQEAARTVVEQQPDVVVVDLDTAGPDGTQTVAATAAAAPVLAVARTAEHTGVLAVVRAGAAGYLVWSSGVAELEAALHRAAAGEAVFSPGLADVVLEAHGRPAGARLPQLTERETDVLRLIVEGLTGRQIAARLVLSPRTVENHVQHVLRKLAVPNRAALVRYAIEHGLA